MLDERKLNQLPTKAREFYRAAYKKCPDIMAWAEFGRNSPELDAWITYFKFKGWMPFAIRALLRKEIEMTLMPTQWPEWFDTEYAARRPVGQIE